MVRRTLLDIFGVGLVASAAGPADDQRDTGFAISAATFDDGAPIPERHTCEGADVSPKLAVSGIADGIESLALVLDDPDAPRATPYVHWLLWNVPASTPTLPEGVARGKAVEALGGARQGTNDAGKVGYSGPCPPPGHGPHTYRFHLYGLDTTLDLAGGASRAKLDAAMQGHIVAEATVTGTYERS